MNRLRLKVAGLVVLAAVATAAQAPIINLLLSNEARGDRRNKAIKTPLEVVLTFKRKVSQANYMSGKFISLYIKNLDKWPRFLEHGTK